jgi:hypothetical protein
MTLEELFIEPLNILAEDVERAEKEMDANDDQYSRRNYIRALFAMIEGTLYLFTLAMSRDTFEDRVMGRDLKRMQECHWITYVRKLDEFVLTGDGREATQLLESGSP